MTKAENRSAGKPEIQTQHIRALMAFIGVLIGPALLAVLAGPLRQIWDISALDWRLVLVCYGGSGIITCVLFVLLTPRLIGALERLEHRLQSMPVADMLSGVIDRVAVVYCLSARASWRL